MALFDLLSIFKSLGGENPQGAAGQPTPLPFVAPMPAINTQPSLSPASLMSLSDFGGGAAQAAPQAAPAPQTAPQAAPGQGGGIGGMLANAVGMGHGGRSFGDLLSIVGGGLSDVSGRTYGAAHEAAAMADARVLQRQRAEQLGALASQLNLSPRERFLFMVAPDKWAEANADRLKFHDVAGGNSYPDADGTYHVAPKLIDNAGSAGTQTATGLTPTGVLPESPQQIAKDEADAAREADRERHEREVEKALLMNAGANVERAGKYKSGGAGGPALPPGVKIGW